MGTKTLFVALSFLLFASPAYPCGFCAGDKAASVYSFKNKLFADRVKARYVSAEVIGDGGESEFNSAVAGLAKLKGVYPKTVRSAFAQKAVSFVHEADIGFQDLAERFMKSQPGWSIKLVEQIN